MTERTHLTQIVSLYMSVTTDKEHKYVKTAPTHKNILCPCSTKGLSPDPVGDP